MEPPPPPPSDVGTAPDVLSQFDTAPGVRISVTGYNDLSPRVGVTYNFTPTLQVLGTYGRYTSRLNDNVGSNSSGVGGAPRRLGRVIRRRGIDLRENVVDDRNQEPRLRWNVSIQRTGARPERCGQRAHREGGRPTLVQERVRPLDDRLSVESAPLGSAPMQQPVRLTHAGSDLQRMCDIVVLRVLTVACV